MQEIRALTKPNVSISTVILGELRSAVPEMLRLVAQENATTNTTNNISQSFPFSKALRDWTSDLIGGTLVRLAAGLQGGEADAQRVLAAILRQVRCTSTTATHDVECHRSDTRTCSVCWNENSGSPVSDLNTPRLEPR